MTLSLLRWWATSFVVGVLGSTIWSTFGNPRALPVGIAVVIAVQSFPLVLIAGLCAWLFDVVLVYLLEPVGWLRLLVAALSGGVVGVGAVLWAEPQAGLVVIGVVAGCTGGLVSQVNSWFERNGWLTILLGTALAVALGLGVHTP